MSFNDYIYWQTLQETGKTPEEIYEYEHPEVVRCKECVDFVYDEQYKCYGCAADNGLMGEIKPDDFCSHGEREGE